jgi:hypothetical protein
LARPEPEFPVRQAAAAMAPEYFDIYLGFPGRKRGFFVDADFSGEYN